LAPLEEILAHASEVTKKRPREVTLLEHHDVALVVVKKLVTIMEDVPIGSRSRGAARWQAGYTGALRHSFRARV
jgi:hypothetical protein